MTRRLMVALILLLGCLADASAAHRAKPADGDASPPPLYEGLGKHHHRVSTRVPAAQRYFDQGLNLYYGFNHDEAADSFREVARLDPNCAMAYWGIALCLGPNYNLPADEERAKAAYQAISKARELATPANQAERDYIGALSQRYSEQADADRKRLDEAYATAMRELAKKYPSDLDAAALFAESMMDLRPWELWTFDGQPQAGTLEIVATLERILAANPEHAGANHLYIHAVEASPMPQRAVPAADRLGALMPGAGHMVHMPSHIYFRVGRYEDAAESNRRAIAVDREYIAQRQPRTVYRMMYYPHNIHFLWSAACYSGQSREATSAAGELAKELPAEMVREMPMIEGFVPTELFTLVRFGRWSEVLAAAAPPEDFAYARGCWHYARGRALAAQGKAGEARSELTQLSKIRAATDPEKLLMRHSQAKLLSVAEKTLHGDLAAREGQIDAAIGDLREAIELQDGFAYDEPPAWYYPVRHTLGAVLLKANRPAEAEAVYRQDLTQYRENGWSLFGLAKALEAQGKEAEATETNERFKRAWTKADIDLTASDY